jgi:hypothetical protein
MNSLEQGIKKQFTVAANDLCLETNKCIKLNSNSQMGYFFWATLNPLNAELNSICHLLALLGVHRILHVSRVRVGVSHLASSTFVYLYNFSLAWLLQDAKINQFVIASMWSQIFASQHSVLVYTIQITSSFSFSYMLMKVLLWSTVAV